MQIVYSKKFISEYRKLPQQIKLLVEKKEKIFKKDSFESSLKTHRLTGKLRGNMAFSVNYKYRVIFVMEGKNEAWFLSIGTHNIYRR